MALLAPVQKLTQKKTPLVFDPLGCEVTCPGSHDNRVSGTLDRLVDLAMLFIAAQLPERLIAVDNTQSMALQGPINTPGH